MTSMNLAVRPLAFTPIMFGMLIAAFGLPVSAFDRDLLIARTPPKTPQEQQRMFHLPPGFRIELVASEPEIVKPINMKFDSAGDLYVTQSYAYPFAELDGKMRNLDTIRRIADKNGDGVPESVSVFVDGLCIPIGLTPIHGGVFGYSIPNLYRFLDKNGDGVADAREIAYKGFEHRDTHGMINGLNYWIDGWIYGCHGFANTANVKGTDGSSIHFQSGNTFRCRIDGSHIEPFSFGQVNPFGMAMDARGDIFTADCHSRPATMILRGGYTQSFGKPHDGLGFAPELMQHGHGSTGIASMVVYAADQFPEAYRGTILMGNPVTGRINHDRLTTKGSTHTAIELPDFVTCDDPWFRPVDMQLAADGSIYVADFYNSIIGHYEVPLTHPLRDKTRGRIWRISYTGDSQRAATALKPVDLSRAPLDVLVAALSNVNLPIRTLATHELVNRIGKPAVQPVRALVESSAVPEGRAHGVWVLFRLGALDRQLAGRLVEDREPLVRLHAVKALGEVTKWSDWQRSAVAKKLRDSDPFVRRAAVDALGTHPDDANVDALAELWRSTDPSDTVLIHVARIALRNSLRAHSDLQALAKRYQSSPDMQRRLIDVCFGIRTSEAASLMLTFLRVDPHITSRATECLTFIANTIEVGRMGEVERFALAYRGKNPDREREVLQGIFRAGRERHAPISNEMKNWAAAVTNDFLNSNDAGRVHRGIELAAETRVPKSAARLAALVSGTRFSQLRGPAADALVQIDAQAALPLIEQVIQDSAIPLDVRCQAVDSLKAVNTPQCRAFLTTLLQVAPARLTVTIVETLLRTKEGATALVEAAEKGHCSPQLLAKFAYQQRLQSAGVPQVQARLRKLLEGLPTADERVNKTITERSAGFAKASPKAERGVAVFQKNCAACHQVASKGNRVGPQLDGAGNRGVERLLEDILDPNRNVDVNFRAMNLVLDDGQIVNGLIIREEGPILVVVDNKGKEQRIASEKVEQRTQSKLSPMPANVSDVLSPQELYDLLAYLLKQRAPGEASR